MIPTKTNNAFSGEIYTLLRNMHFVFNFYTQCREFNTTGELSKTDKKIETHPETP